MTVSLKSPALAAMYVSFSFVKRCDEAASAVTRGVGGHGLNIGFKSGTTVGSVSFLHLSPPSPVFIRLRILSQRVQNLVLALTVRMADSECYQPLVQAAATWSRTA